MDKNEVLQSQENQTKEVMQEIKEEYTKTADFFRRTYKSAACDC